MRRVVFDENAPKPLARLLRASGLDVSTFPNSWKGLTNGRLLERIERDGFSVLLTCDRSISAQQNMRGRTIGLVVLATNDLSRLAKHLDAIAAEIRSVQAGQCVRVDVPAD